MDYRSLIPRYISGYIFYLLLISVTAQLEYRLLNETGHVAPLTERSERGLVQVRHLAAGRDWGNVCITARRTQNVTHYICRQMGFYWGEHILDNTPWVVNNITLRSSGLYCPVSLGSTLSFTACESANHCGNKDLTIQCYNTSVRLVKDNPLQQHGALMMMTQGKERLVCRYGFNDSDARVACREIGYVDGITLNSYFFNNELLPTTSERVEDLECSGTESSISQCRFYTGTGTCDARDVAGVHCFRSEVTDGHLNQFYLHISRLGGASHGTIFVQIKAVWSSICNRHMRDQEAQVLCKSKGFFFGSQLGSDLSSSTTTPRSPDPMLIRIAVPNCAGTETSITDCPGWNQHDELDDFHLESDLCTQGDNFGVLCHNQSLEYRINDGKATGVSRGYAEIRHQGAWGTICNQGWSDRDAGVFCRKLGFVDGSALILPGRRSDINPLAPVYLNGVECAGTEDHILACKNTGWNIYQRTPYCSLHNHDAGVQCYSEVRLGGDQGPSTGRVEVYRAGEWLTICGDDWDDNDAAVVCRQLGYTYGRALCCSNYGPKREETGALTGVHCNGTEARVADCEITGGYCRGVNSNYGSVYCYNQQHVNTMETFLDTRLISAESTQYAGRVRVRLGGVTSGKVCSYLWDDVDASVFCRQIGWTGGVAYQHASMSDGPWLMTAVSCHGNETSLTECPYSDRLVMPCPSEAGVVCYNSSMTTTRVDLIGRVEITRDGVTGYICDSDWTVDDAMVTCQQLGYVYGIPSQFALRASDPVTYMTAPECRGTEASIYQCTNSGWHGAGEQTGRNYTSYCNSGQAAAVNCFKNVKLDVLSKGDGFEIGRVQTTQHAQWAGVCGSGWDDIDASVTCRELGFNYGEAVNSTFFGYNYVFTYINNLRCQGNEASILNCSYNNASCEQRTTNYAIAACSKNPIDHTLYIGLYDSADNSSSSGRINVTRYGIQGKICGAHWNDAAANVTCKQLGFPGGVASKYRIYTRMTTWLLNYDCHGNETRLEDCRINEEVSAGLPYCPSTEEVGVICHKSTEATGLEFRLVGSVRGEGRVEVCLDGECGGICNYGWNVPDSRVLCQQMGYLDGVPIEDSVVYEQGPADYMLSALDCRGVEETLLLCPNAGLKRHLPGTTTQCGANKHAAVRCYSDIRIENNAAAGPLLVHQNAAWGYVCDTDFDDVDATVACRQLGYQNGRAICCSAFGRNYFYSTLWKDIACSGAEGSLAECPHYSGNFVSCRSRDYASVMCFNNETHPDVSLKLIDSPLPYTGIVQIEYAGIWGNICPNSWDDNDATVVCRQLGLGQKGQAYFNTQKPRNTPYWVKEVHCTGNETSLSVCENSGYGSVRGCDSRTVSGVICYNNDISVDIVGGSGRHSGRVEITVDGNIGSICAYGWGDRDADVLCREKGFTSGIAEAAPSPGSGEVWLINVGCHGNETSLSRCPHIGWGQEVKAGNCDSHQSDAGVYCYGNIRLSNGPGRNFGQLEIFRPKQNSAGVWLKLCDDGSFTREAAQVVCRSLGFIDGVGMCCSALGDLDRTFRYTTLIQQISCQGNESDIDQCRFTEGECSQKKYMSVYCASEAINNQSDMTASLLPGAYMEYNGAVRVTLGGLTGRVCAYNWTDRAAQAVCRELGAVSGVAYQLTPQINEDSTPFVIGRVNCSDEATRLADCRYAGPGEDVGCDARDKSAGVLCYRAEGVTFNISGMSQRNYGRVEVSLEGQRGAICNTGWGDSDAKVVCRSLHYTDGVLYRPSTHPPYTGPILMSSLGCRGDEDSLLMCENSGWANVPAYCNGPRYLAYAYCFSSARLNSGGSYPSRQGAVEMFVDGRWSSVCDTGFDDKAANVVCRELGYSWGVSSCCDAYGPHYRDRYVQGVECQGDEETLAECSHTVLQDKAECKYASAVCFEEENHETDYSLRIYSEVDLENTGRLQVQYNEVWGRICADGWDDDDALVACKTLGYQNGEAYYHMAPSTSRSRNLYTSGSLFSLLPGYRQVESSSSFLTGAGPWWTGAVNCSGSEVDIRECAHAPLGEVTTCNSTHTAGVLCYNNNGVVYKLSDGGDSYGRVEVAVDGEWGTICDLDWDRKDAQVFCRQFGYVDGEAKYFSTYGRGSGPVWMSRLMCEGNETRLNACPHSGWKIETRGICADHSRDAGVICHKQVRIDSTSSRSPTAGPALFFHNSTWQGVCSTGLTDVTARVMCREMGYPDGKAVCCGAYGYIRWPTMNYTLECNGKEKKISECLTTNPCNSTEYSSVVCFTEDDRSNNDIDYAFSLTPSRGSNSTGRVSVTTLGLQGRVCREGWDDREAAVLCRALGYREGVAYSHYKRVTSDLDFGVYPYLAGGFNCTGLERSLTECRYGNRLSLGNCTTDHDAGALCYNGEGVKYRIANGNKTNPNQGRVEVSLGGVWGTVCDAYFDEPEASVFCRSLGFMDGEAFHESRFGPGSGPVWLTHVHCNGSEASLQTCAHEGWNTSYPGMAPTWRLEVASGAGTSGVTTLLRRASNCSSHDYDASVYCFGTVRLSEGANASFGAVQVYHDNQWTLVCDDGWDDRMAVRMCREMGLADGKVVPRSGFSFNQSDVMMVATCAGSDVTLTSCALRAAPREECASGHYASVFCSETTIQDSPPSLYLYNTSADSDTYSGIVQVTLGGVTGRVCLNTWGDVEADVTCRSLGYGGGVSYVHVQLSTYPVVMSNVTCRGNEKSLFECNYSNWGDNTTCKHNTHEAGVICYMNKGVQYRLSDGDGRTYGRVEISYDGEWGTVCDVGWDRPDARVICRQLGFEEGMAQRYSYYGPGAGPVYLQSLSCEGDEDSLLTCLNSGFNHSWSHYQLYNCDSHRRDASVQCYNQSFSIGAIRLINSDSDDAAANFSGRVEVFITGVEEWGSVCFTDFDDNDAAVICRQLGLGETGEAVTDRRFSDGLGRIWVSGLRCHGNESSLSACAQDTLGVNTCNHWQDAGIICPGPATTLPVARYTTGLPTHTPSTPTTPTTPTTSTSATTRATRITQPITVTSRATFRTTILTAQPTTIATRPTTEGPTPRPTYTPPARITTRYPPSPTTPTTTQTTQTTQTTTQTTQTTEPSTTTTAKQEIPKKPQSEPILPVVLPLVLIFLLALAIIVFVLYRRGAVAKLYRSPPAQGAHPMGAISMSSVSDAGDVIASPLHGATVDPDKNTQYTNKLYDLVGQHPAIYETISGAAAAKNNNTSGVTSGNESPYSDTSQLTRHEVPPARDDTYETIGGVRAAGSDVDGAGSYNAGCDVHEVEGAEQGQSKV